MDHFRDLALGQIPRILGLGDRSGGSPTYGCFDRYYWHYRFLDFPNARFQEAAWLLALLWHENFQGNIYFSNVKIREWAESALQFWLRSRNRDGSVAEAYPFERSFCATSFTAYAVTECLLLLGGRLPASLEITLDWLVRNNNPEVANQMAAAAVALNNGFRLTGLDKYRSAAAEKVARLLAMQRVAGYFPEYGGYDIGYSSLTISCLAHYWLATRENELWHALLKADTLLQDRVRKDGSYDISGTSRQTQFLYPFGLIILKSDVVTRLLSGLDTNRVINPAWLDDRYVIQLATNYLQSYLVRNHADDADQTSRAAAL